MGGMKPKSIGAPNPVGMKPPTAKPPSSPFMADGGMGGDPGTDADDMGAGVKPSPDALHYHPDPQMCSSCEYMQGQGNCAILGIQVTPDGGCVAWEGKEGGMGEEMGEPEEDMGAPPPSPGGRSMYGG